MPKENNERFVEKKWGIKKENIGTLENHLWFSDNLRVLRKGYAFAKERDETGKVPEGWRKLYITNVDSNALMALKTEDLKKDLETAIADQRRSLFKIADFLERGDFNDRDAIESFNKYLIERLCSLFYFDVIKEESADDIKTLRDEILIYLKLKNYGAVLRSLYNLTSCLGVDLVDVLRNPEKPIEIIAQ